MRGNSRRPMLVISDEIYNRSTHMVVGFPITSSEIAQTMPAATIMRIEDQSIHGYAVFSGILGYDYQARHGKIVGEINRNSRKKALIAVRSIFGLLLD
ncbi:type II toxin-antitoxin system PemK/MazF family toxin [Levilactobacillus acidifarinae]|uniref:type II toxin-antitoxin system PemK/MazF family toxin n=1 Tax=Levilactobacillus acidifarinae TaxID=267364 RepID=UPI001CDD8689